jgi:hypothetical protein
MLAEAALLYVTGSYTRSGSADPFVARRVVCQQDIQLSYNAVYIIY